MDSNPLRSLLTVDDVAAALNRSTHSIYRRVRRGEIGGVVRIGRSVYFDPEKLAEWQRAGGTPHQGGAERRAG